APLDELHREVRPAIEIAHVVDLHDVRMTQLQIAMPPLVVYEFGDALLGRRSSSCSVRSIRPRASRRCTVRMLTPMTSAASDSVSPWMRTRSKASRSSI